MPKKECYLLEKILNYYIYGQQNKILSGICSKIIHAGGGGRGRKMGTSRDQAYILIHMTSKKESRLLCSGLRFWLALGNVI